MFKIQTLNEISDVIYESLPQDVYSISKEDKEADAVIVRSADMHALPIAEGLLAVARAGAGTNNIPIDAMSEKGIVVFNTPGANANAVKELVIATLCVLSRNVLSAAAWAQTLKGNGADVPKLVEKGKGQFVGPELKGKTLGVLGLGAIGAPVANTAHALGMNVIGFDPFISVEKAWSLSRGITRAPSEDALICACDYLTIHAPLMDSTRGMLGEAAFSKMKKGAYVLNFSRAELVDSPAMLKALASGQIAGYAVDFPTEEMLGVEGIIAIPHLGSSTPESEDNCAVMAAQQLHDFLQDGNIINSVNMPACDMPRSGGPRVTVVHRNVPNTVGQMTSTVAKYGLNISNMINKSQGQMAYTMLDIDGEVSEALLRELSALEGNLKVRVII